MDLYNEKNISINIKSLSNISKYGTIIKFFSINKSNYLDCIDFDFSEYFKGKALSVLTFTLNTKNGNIGENEMHTFRSILEMFSSSISNIFGLNNDDKILFRANDNNISIDLVYFTGIIIQKLIDLNLNLSNYYEFQASIKSAFSPENIFTLLNDEQLLKNITNNFILIKGSSHCIKSIVGSLMKSLESIKYNNEKLRKKSDDLINNLYMFYLFISFEMNLEYDQNNFVSLRLIHL